MVLTSDSQAASFSGNKVNGFLNFENFDLGIGNGRFEANDNITISSDMLISPSQNESYEFKTHEMCKGRDNGQDFKAEPTGAETFKGKSSSSKLSIYPKPVDAGKPLRIFSPQNGNYTILDATGSIIAKGKLKKGVNTLKFSKEGLKIITNQGNAYKILVR